MSSYRQRITIINKFLATTEKHLLISSRIKETVVVIGAIYLS